MLALGLAGLGSMSGVTPAATAGVVVKRIDPPGLLTPRGYTQVVTTSGRRTIYISSRVAANAKGGIVGSSQGVEPPAIAVVGVSALANPDWLIEIELVAVVA